MYHFLGIIFEVLLLIVETAYYEKQHMLHTIYTQYAIWNWDAARTFKSDNKVTESE